MTAKVLGWVELRATEMNVLVLIVMEEFITVHRLGTIIILMKIKYPVHIMVFQMVTCDSDIKAPFIFSQGLRLNIEAYIKCLEEAVLP